jgi:uncharacterized protein
MKDGDLLGRIIDTFVVTQLRAQLVSCETQPRLYHVRQEKGQHEVDLIVEYGGRRVFAFEIKASSAPTRDDARHLAWLRPELGDRFIGGTVLHTGPRAFRLSTGNNRQPHENHQVIHGQRRRPWRNYNV